MPSAFGTVSNAARTASNSSASRDHGAATSIVSTTKPLRVTSCRAEVSLRVLKPIGDEVRRRRRSLGARVATTAIVASTMAGSPSSRTSSTLCVPSPWWLRAASTSLYGEGPPASATSEHGPAGVDALGERRTCTPPVVPRPAGGVREPDPRDHAERALGTEEELGEIGPDRGGRSTAGAYGRPVGEHDLEADDEVLDLAERVEVLAGASAGHPSAHGREVEALREVPDAEPVALLQLGLQVRSDAPGEDLDDARDRVHLADSRQVGEVDEHAAVNGNRRPGTRCDHRRR